MVKDSEQRYLSRMSGHILFQGDCQNELRRLANESIDLVLTSPPYANRRESTYGGAKADEYVKWILPITEEIRRVLKPEGTFILNIKEPAINGERHTMVFDLVLEMRKQGWLWTEEFIWHKKNCYPGKWPNRFRDAWERIFQFNKQRRFKMFQDEVMVPVGDWYDARMKNLSEADMTRTESKVGSGFGKNIENWKDRDMVYPTNVLHRATECSNRKHSAAFPIWMPDWFIDLFTSEYDWVLDPFVGSGTTMISGLNKNRNVIGIEKHPEYFENLKRHLDDNYSERQINV